MWVRVGVDPVGFPWTGAAAPFTPPQSFRAQDRRPGRVEEGAAVPLPRAISMPDQATAPILDRAAPPPWAAAAAARVRRFAAVLARVVPADARLPVALALGALLLAFGGAALNRRAADWLMRAE
ncbi:MAG: hypothetical protein ICV73_28955, partial [Acetobacteraceae bacterium]|nr:hypothetical protein [Acetobacteraceae bacterium]